MSIITPTLTPLVVSGAPLTNITPFTYRDGLTYVELLQCFRVYITQTLVPEIEKIIGESNAWTEDQIAALTAYVDDAVEAIVNNSIEVQDPLVATLIESEISETHAAIESYTSSAILDTANPVGEAVTDRLSTDFGANVKSYGAVGDGVTDDSSAIAFAHSENELVRYPSSNYTPGATDNLYNENVYQNAMGERLMSGTPGDPVTDARPMLWMQKHSAASRDNYAQEWEQGAGYFALIKEAGSAYGAALSAYAEYNSGTGQTIATHTRGVANHANSQVWGLWAYAAANNPAVVPISIVGEEININNKAPDQGWMGQNLVAGNSRGLIINTADGGNAITQALSIGRSGGAGGIHTGIVIKSDAIVPASDTISNASVANNEAIFIGGATNAANGATGIRFKDGRFRTGISFAEATFDANAAILMGKDHRIVVGDGPGSSRYLGFDYDNSLANFNNLTVGVNGVKVVGTRRTGWAAASGTATRTAFATSSVTLPQLAEHVKALIDDLINHGLIGA